MSMTISANQLMMQMGQMKTQIRSHPMLETNPLVLKTANNQALKSQPEQVNFTDLMAGAISHVNSLQKQTGILRKDFEMGKEGIDLVQVMIASEKSSVAFSALLETRNKLLKAYNEIKNTRV
ncbi:MAG: flagellar hook-basal body complex protein FliE [Pseudomonadota bacterium]